MLIILYIILSVCIIILVLIRKQIDFLSTGTMTFLLYTSPCITGTTWVRSFGDSYAYYETISKTTYFSVIFQLVIIVLFLLYKIKREDLYHTNFQRVCVLQNYAFKTSGNTIFWRIILAVCASGFIYNIFFVVGISNFFSYASKTDLAREFSLTFTVWGAILCLFYFMMNKKYIESIISFLMILSYFILGSRAYITTALLGLFFITTIKTKRSFQSNIKLFFVGLFSAIFLMLYKYVYIAIRALDFDSAKRILSSSDVSWNLLESGEFITVFSNYDYIVRHNFSYPLGDVLARFVSIIPFANNYIDTKYDIRLAVTAQYDFYNIHYGAGSNFWGESYAMGGLLFVFLLTFVWLNLLDKAYVRLQKSEGTAIFTALAGTYCSFYIHRLDWVQVLGCIKAVFLYYILYEVFRILMGSNRRKVTSN